MPSPGKPPAPPNRVAPPLGGQGPCEISSRCCPVMHKFQILSTWKLVAISTMHHINIESAKHIPYTDLRFEYHQVLFQHIKYLSMQPYFCQGDDDIHEQWSATHEVFKIYATTPTYHPFQCPTGIHLMSTWYTFSTRVDVSTFTPVIFWW